MARRLLGPHDTLSCVLMCIHAHSSMHVYVKHSNLGARGLSYDLQNFLWGYVPRPPRESMLHMLSVLHTLMRLHSYLYPDLPLPLSKNILKHLYLKHITWIHIIMYHNIVTVHILTSLPYTAKCLHVTTVFKNL